MAGTDSAPRALAWAELNLLNVTQTLPELEGSSLTTNPTDVYDLNGELLFQRFPVDRPTGPAFADAAADPRLGAPLISVSFTAWDEGRLREQALEAFRASNKSDFDDVRFVAFSFPKVAVQFLRGGREVALLELGTWQQVPRARKRKKDEPPRDFDRWSYLDETPRPILKRKEGRYLKRVDELRRLLDRHDFVEIRAKGILDIIDISTLLYDSRVLHYTTRDTDHQTCFELRGQETNVWCVGASVQMVLDFYRYEYTQTRLAQELGLGTKSNPNGLPYTQDNKVVTVLEKMSSNALDANMNTSPTWAEFRTEIRANRPLISFVPGHSRAVAGYTRTGLAKFSQFRGLLVYDPWPPDAGVITRWENFDAQTYRRTFTAQVTLV